MKVLYRYGILVWGSLCPGKGEMNICDSCKADILKEAKMKVGKVWYCIKCYESQIMNKGVTSGRP